MSQHRRSLAKLLLSLSKGGTPMRHARGVVVSSTIGTTVVTIDGGATHVTAYNYGHLKGLIAGTVVDLLLVGNVAYVIGVYGLGVHMRYYRAAAWTNPTTATTFILDTKQWDTANAYNTTTGNFTAPSAGFYQVVFQSVITATTNHQANQNRVYVNGAAATVTQGGWSQVAPDACVGLVVDTYQLNAGDTITAVALSNAALAGNPGSTLTFLAIDLL